MKKILALALFLTASWASGQVLTPVYLTLQPLGGGTAPVSSTSGYATVKEETSALTQRSIITFLGTSITCVDNAGNSATECTVTAGGAPTDATYLVDNANGSLSAEVVMAAGFSAFGASPTCANFATLVSGETGTCGTFVLSVLPRFVGLATDNGSTGGGFIDFYEDSDGGTDKLRLFLNNTLSADRTLGIPALTADDTIMTLNATQTVANKTFTIPECGNGSTSSCRFHLNEDTDNGSNFLNIAAPESITANRVLSIPEPSADDIIIIGTATQTMSNKTLTTPTVGNGATSGGYTRYVEDTDNGANYIQVTGQDTLSADYTLTLPAKSGTFMVSDTTSATSYPGLGFDPSTQPRPIFEEFYGAPANTGAGTRAPLGQCYVVGTGTGSGYLSNAEPTGDGNHPGVASLTTGTSSTGTASVTCGFGNDTYQIRGGEIFETDIYVATASLAGGGTNPAFEVRFGFCDSTSNGNCSDGITITWDEAVNTNWVCRSEDVGTSSTASTTDATAAAWHKLRIWIETLTSVRYYVDGVELSCSPITTANNIPDGSSSLTAVQAKITASNDCNVNTECTMSIDYIYFYPPPGITR